MALTPAAIGLLLLLLAACGEALKQPKLVFSDEFDELDTFRWQHEVTLGGGGKWVDH